LLWFYIKNTSSEYSGGYFYFKTKYLEHFGVPANKGSEFVELVSDQLIRSKGLENQRKKLLKLLLTVSSSFKVTKILSMWFVMTFEDFLNELKKQKIKFSLSDQAEWMEYFETEKAKALSIQSDIDKTDREIDAMVYELYGLTEEEIAIVEGVTK